MSDAVDAHASAGTFELYQAAVEDALHALKEEIEWLKVRISVLEACVTPPQTPQT